MRTIIFVVSCGFCLGQVSAAEDAAPPVVETPNVRQISYADVKALGQAAMDTAYDGRNVFIRREREDELLRIAEQFRDARIAFAVRVLRVTEEEVFIDVPSAWPARVVLRHFEPPWFGNLRSRTYCSSPSSRLHEFYALPVALRIGSEIPFEGAKQLQRGDLLIVEGRVESTLMCPGSTFYPPVLVVVSDWSVSGG